jgi:hypothetical protein
MPPDNRAAIIEAAAKIRVELIFHFVATIASSFPKDHKAGGLLLDPSQFSL